MNSKFSKFFILLICLVLCLSACSPSNVDAPPTGDTSDKNGGETETDDNKEQDGEQVSKDYMQSVKILAIGNSFSDDAMEHLWNVLHNVGVKEIILGNLYIGGCSIDRHLSNLKSGDAAYQYRKNTDGKWITENDSIINALFDEEWDIVTMQQVSQDSGNLMSYDSLDEFVSSVLPYTPIGCKLYWHMTWAYQQDSTHSGFVNYGNDQLTMYDSITYAVQNLVLKNENFTDAIPSGTSIQNLRTSFIGDTLTRDGYHMSLGLGRYTVSLAWAAKLLGADILYNVSWSPEGISDEEMNAALKAVKDAILNPYSVTEQ